MNNNRKFLMVFSLILVLIFILVIWLLHSGNKGSINGGGNTPTPNNNGNNQNNNGTNNNNNNPSDENEGTKLYTERNYQSFFTINNVINTYYRNFNNSNKKLIIDVLDKDYKDLYGIKKDNINNFLKNNGFEVSYFAKKIYRLKTDTITYYFVDGEEQYDNYATYKYVINDNVDYLVIVDNRHATYSITPLKVDSLLDYAQKYKIKGDKEIEKNDNNYYKTIETTDEMISLYYLSYFKSLLMRSPERAYEMLSNDSKIAYENSETFISEAYNISSEIPSTILNYSVTGKDSKRIYKVICMNHKKIMFEETNIMEYKVTFL